MAWVRFRSGARCGLSLLLVLFSSTQVFLHPEKTLFPHCNSIRVERLQWKLYNNPSYSRILIGSRLWSIRGQTHDWRHHYKVFPSAVLKWRKVLRIRILFYVTGQKIRYIKVFPRHWTGLRSQKTKDEAVCFRKWYRNNFLAASFGSRARLNHAWTWSW